MHADYCLLVMCHQRGQTEGGVAFDDEHYGWYIGTIAGTSLAARDLKQTPRANCVVSYKRRETTVASLNGKVACELSKHLYGVDQWWVLLKKKA